MRYKSQRIREAYQFADEGTAYIHTEVVANKPPETILAGDLSLMILGVCGEVNRIAEKTHTDFESVLKAVLCCKTTGYKEMVKLFELSQGRIIPKDKEEDNEEDKIIKLKQKIAKLDEVNRRYQEEIESKEWIISELKRKIDKVQTTCDKRIREVTKELRECEHRMKEMEEARFAN